MYEAILRYRQKAFDTVNHKSLLDKMCHYGIRSLVYEWFKSYLNSRKQYTYTNDHYSDVAEVCYDVPQGSLLGPLLFLIYINDICSAVPNAKVKYYATPTPQVECIQVPHKLSSKGPSFCNIEDDREDCNLGRL